VAPLAKQTLPRLELCAAVLRAELAERIKKDLRIRIDEVQYWTDSIIVLAWINTTASSFHTFVANRIARIHELSNPEQWVLVASEDNPADLAPRGCSATQLNSVAEERLCGSIRSLTVIRPVSGQYQGTTSRRATPEFKSSI